MITSSARSLIREFEVFSLNLSSGSQYTHSFLHRFQYSPLDLIRMQAPPTPTHHIAAMLLPEWGHTISYIHAATRMLATEPGLVITIVQHNLVGTRVHYIPLALSLIFNLK
jgi:hypothetical protein